MKPTVFHEYFVPLVSLLSVENKVVVPGETKQTSPSYIYNSHLPVLIINIGANELRPIS